MRLYHYVGPRRIAERIGPEPLGYPIRSSEDVRRWMTATSQEGEKGSLTATFVVNADGTLLVADRRSEHVACAGGKPVRSAGEMTFEIGKEVEVVSVSNQSTGYCPEPESWPALAAAFQLADLKGPAGFAMACDFRRCPSCGNLNLIKDGAFECDVCRGDLPLEYNVRDSSNR